LQSLLTEDQKEKLFRYFSQLHSHQPWQAVAYPGFI
jgi:hypothetical protein